MAQHTLHLEGLTKRYGGSLAVDDISLNVAPGQFLTLLGPSGSGKTTLLMMIAGFVAPTAGVIRLGTDRIDNLPPERRQFGMVFQGYALFPHLTVAENVAFPLKIRKVARTEMAQRVREALDSVQLSAMAERMPKQLSGGQQQRVALARALVFKPHLLLLDEPLSALDKNLRTDMQGELSHLHQRIGLTFVYVTHDQQEALSMSDEIAILRDGRLVQHGTPRELYDEPGSRFVAGFLGRSNFLTGRVERVMADRFSYACGDARLVQAGQGAAVGDTVVVALRPEKIRILDTGDNADNRVTGHVREATYLGDAFSLVVDAGALGSMTLNTPTWRHVLPQPGAAIEIGWDSDAAIAVQDS